MKKSGAFAVYRSKNGWPTVAQLEPFFLAPAGKEWSYEGGSDSWALYGDGLCGTDRLPEDDQVSVSLRMIGNPDHGVYLQHDKWDGRTRSRRTFYSKGDLTRLREYVWSLHGTPLSVGLFIPFATAWKAVKEFIETDGELPQSIEWVASRDLPSYAFPDPSKTPPPPSFYRAS